jgi:carboxypeptidase D
MYLRSVIALVLVVSQAAVSPSTAYSKTKITKESQDESLRRWWRSVSTSYPRYQATTSMIFEMQRLFPNLVQIYSIGTTVNRKEMWVVHLAENARKPRPLLRPMVKIAANMHGDEVLGRSLNLMLTVQLLHRYKQGDTRIKRLLHSTDLHLLLSANPDGYEMAVEGGCRENTRYSGRHNANGVDLNRNFPDQFSTTTPVPELETVHLMNWIVQNPFVLSANMHGGAVVASYPFDSINRKAVLLSLSPGFGYYGRGVKSPTPDNAFFLYLAKLYANTHKEMHLGQKDEVTRACGDDEFKGGIINGAEWYNVEGGMQDFNYVHSNCFEITFELSCCKFPKANQLR